MKLKLSKTGLAVLVGAVVMGIGIGALHLRDRAHERTFFPEGDRRDRTWAVTPVAVAPSAGVNEQFARAVHDAVASINDQVGCNLLTLHGAPVQIRILAVTDDVPCQARGEPLPDGAGAASYVCHDGTTDVLLDGLQVEPRKVYVLLVHELGHALGLDDDPGSDDVMGPHLSEQSWQDVTRPLPWLSTKDRGALHARYCERGTR